MDKNSKARFDRALLRLTNEVYNLRRALAARTLLRDDFKEVGSRPELFRLIDSAIQSDILIRLFRIFEDWPDRVASFWYLHRCATKVVEQWVDIGRLQDLSVRLKTIRDKAFVHIDKEGVFDPGDYYRKARLGGEEIIENVETLWKLLGHLHLQEFSENAPHDRLKLTFDQLKEIYARDLEVLGNGRRT